MKYIRNFQTDTLNSSLKITQKKSSTKAKPPQKAARNANFIAEDFKFRQEEIDKVLVEKQLESILPMVEEGYHLKYVANKINVDIDQLFDWYIKGYEGNETYKEFADCYWECRMMPSVEDFQSLFDIGISENFLIKYIMRKSVKPEYDFWKKLGLFKFTNEMYSEEEQFGLYKNKVLDVRENIEKLIEAADDDDVNVPIEELIDDIDDADLKREIENFLDKSGDNDE